MQAKERVILAVTISSVMALMVTMIATLLNLGLRTDFLMKWLKAYAVAWPVAATTAFLFMPVARRVTTRIVELIEG